MGWYHAPSRMSSTNHRPTDLTIPMQRIHIQRTPIQRIAGDSKQTLHSNKHKFTSSIQSMTTMIALPLWRGGPDQSPQPSYLMARSRCPLFVPIPHHHHPSNQSFGVAPLAPSAHQGSIITPSSISPPYAPHHCHLPCHVPARRQPHTYTPRLIGDDRRARMTICT